MEQHQMSPLGHAIWQRMLEDKWHPPATYDSRVAHAEWVASIALTALEDLLEAHARKRGGSVDVPLAHLQAAVTAKEAKQLIASWASIEATLKP